jgi:transposase
MGLRCKGCGGEEHVKNGFMRGKQRYRCKACGLNFTDTPPRGMPLRVKVEAVLLYLSGLSMNRTAKLLGVSTPSVQAWIERFAEVYAQKPEPEGHAVVVELDEMWHFLKKTRPAKLAGRVGARSRSGRLAGRGGSGNVGHGIGASARGRGEPRATGADQSGRDRVPHSGEVG